MAPPPSASRCRATRRPALPLLAAGAGLLAAAAATASIAATFVGGTSAGVVARPGDHTSRELRGRGPTALSVADIDAPPVGYDTQRKVLKVVKYPHPALRRKNEEVEVFDQKLHMLAVNLFDTLKEEGGGVGLAAPQVGVNIRVMAYFEMRGTKAVGKLLVNPQITKKSEQVSSSTEECLSFPGIKGDVERSEWVEVEAQTIDGKKRTMRLEGFEARLFQHEYDHLDGVVFIDRMDKSELDGQNLLKLESLKQQYVVDGGQEAML